MTYRSTGSGEWPPGIYWTPGEERTLPDGYPCPGEVPPWLTLVAQEAPQPGRRRPRAHTPAPVAATPLGAAGGDGGEG